MTRVLYALFILSGAAGLIYESIWTRYLGLFVGHDAYAQIIVLVIFLGGMSVGAVVISRYSERIREPLQGYAIIEFVVGCIGVVFHDVFGWTTSFAYESIYPHLAGSPLLTIAKWSIASALILPQSILLGATFPLMSAGVLRLRRRDEGRRLSILYFANSLGAALGVLVAGFYLVSLSGLPGTLLVAAMLNLVVALVTFLVVVRGRSTAPVEAPAASPAREGSARARSGLEPERLRRLLLFTSFGTATASFIYEVDWIRMLALVLGSATHAFELMLSAFILGLALGAFWIRGRIERIHNPVRTLGLIQWTMGLLAMATLPIYMASFDWIAGLLSTFARTDLGYAGFTIARYAICLLVMLPATFCAGMTLPLITRTLLRSGHGERAIGGVYAWNTLGSIVGVILGGLVLLPLLGVKAMLIVGAAIDMAIGVMLYLASSERGTVPRRLGWALGAGAVVASLVIAMRVPMEQRVLASGVYRSGVVVEPGAWDMLFYKDGRTASVSAIRVNSTGQVSLATNGKADASLGRQWFTTCGDGLQRLPLSGDAATQALTPLITLAHVPNARNAAIIGYGSGMTTHVLLGSPASEGSRHRGDRAPDDRGRSGLLSSEPPRHRGSPLTAGDRRRQVVLRLAASAVRRDPLGAFQSLGERRVRPLYLGVLRPASELPDGRRRLRPVDPILRAERRADRQRAGGDSPELPLVRHVHHLERRPAGGRVESAPAAQARLVGVQGAGRRSRPLPVPADHARGHRAPPAGEPARAGAAARLDHAGQLRLLPGARPRRRAAPLPPELRGGIPGALLGLVQPAVVHPGMSGARRRSTRLPRCPNRPGCAPSRWPPTSRPRAAGRRAIRPCSKPPTSSASGTPGWTRASHPAAGRSG